MAAAIVPNSPAQQHNFHSPSDLDWVVFTGLPGYTYEIRTLNLAPSVDTILCLYGGATMDLLACDDDSGGEPLASRLVASFASSGTYYVEVTNRDPIIWGCTMRYQLQLSSTAFTLTPTATVTPTSTETGTPTPTPTVTRTPTASPTPRGVYYFPIIMSENAPAG